jgi:hypothetical protein
VRTTLEIDDDVLAAAKEAARREGSTVGRILSRVAREQLVPAEKPGYRNGVPLLPNRPTTFKPTVAFVKELLEEEE